MISHRVRYRVIGGHVHAHFYSSEFGPATTHGKNGELIFRVGSDWNSFMHMFRSTTGGDAVIVFVNETGAEHALCGQPPDDVRGFSRRYCTKRVSHEIIDPADTAHRFPS